MHSLGARITSALLPAAVLLLASGCQQRPAGEGTTAMAALVAGPTCSAGPTAHEKHIGMFSCDTCHPCGGQVGFDVATTFPRGTTTSGGTITRSTATTPASCAVACHYPMGAPARSIAFTAPGPLACTECHAVARLPAAHPTIGNPLPTRADCLGCHDLGQHMTGQVIAAGHPAAWMDQASAGFHAYSANQGLASCRGCHGENLDGVGGTATTSCASCHGATWRTSCTMCHGGIDNQTGAPPRTTWGNSLDSIRAGAHTKHVAAGALAPAVACATCHPVPGDALSAGHVDGGTAEVAFGGLATAAGAAPAWNRTSATCGTYCHGATMAAAGGTNRNPIWNFGAGQAACGTCHGVPPPAPHPSVPGGITTCSGCHPETMDAAGGVIAPAAGGKHLDGTLQVAGGGTGGCGACHGNPPGTQPSPLHPVYLFAAPCVGCHPGTATVDSTGATVLVPGGQHQDGTIQYTFAGHPPDWAVPGAGGTIGGLHSNQTCMGCSAGPGQFYMSDYYNQCTQCHGAAGNFNTSGGTSRVSCGACHPAFFDAGGQTSCNFCH